MDAVITRGTPHALLTTPAGQPPRSVIIEQNAWTAKAAEVTQKPASRGRRQGSHLGVSEEQKEKRRKQKKISARKMRGKEKQRIIDLQAEQTKLQEEKEQLKADVTKLEANARYYKSFLKMVESVKTMPRQPELSPLTPSFFTSFPPSPPPLSSKAEDPFPVMASGSPTESFMPEARAATLQHSAQDAPVQKRPGNPLPAAEVTMMMPATSVGWIKIPPDLELRGPISTRLPPEAELDKAGLPLAPIPSTSAGFRPVSFNSAGFGPMPSTSAGFGPAPSTSAGFGPVPSTYAGFGPVPSTSAGFGPVPSISAGFGPVPSTSAGFGPVPSTSVDFGPAPSTSAGFGPVPSTSGDFGSVPSTTADGETCAEDQVYPGDLLEIFQFLASGTHAFKGFSNLDDNGELMTDLLSNDSLFRAPMPSLQEGPPYENAE